MTKSTNTTIGCVMNRTNRLCIAETMSSRSPGTCSRPAAGSARRARVTGPPSTSRIGAIMPSTMCAIMCIENCGRAVAGQAGRGRDQQHRAADEPGGGASRRPVHPVAPQSSHADQIERRDDDRGGAQQPVESPVREQGDHRRRAVQRETQGEFQVSGGHASGRWRRGAGQRRGHADGRRHDRHLDDGEPDQRTPLPAGDRRQGASAVQVADDAEHGQQTGLEQHEPAVRCRPQVRQVADPQPGVAQSGRRDGDEGKQGDRRVPPGDDVEMVDPLPGQPEQRDQPTDPEADADQVVDHAVHRDVVVAGRGRVARVRLRRRAPPGPAREVRRPTRGAARPGPGSRSAAPRCRR